MSSAENLSPQVIQRIIKEVRQLSKNPPEGIRYVPSGDDNLSEIHVDIDGPAETPYAKGCFRMKLILSEGFPSSPPKGYFLTKIFHPNVSANGDICVNTLKKDWSPELGIIHVVQVIRCLLIVPFPESSLNEDAGKLFMDSYDEYARRARLMTSVHAKKEEKKDDLASSSPDKTSDSAAVIETSTNGSVVMKRKASTTAGVKPKAASKKTAKKRGLKRL